MSSMHLVGLQLLSAFSVTHPTARSWLKVWITDTKGARWATPQDIRQRYNTASFLSGSRVVFNVKGNDFRLVTTVAYQTQIVVVNWIGTHGDYSKVNWETTRNEAKRD